MKVIIFFVTSISIIYFSCNTHNTKASNNDQFEKNVTFKQRNSLQLNCPLSLTT